MYFDYLVNCYTPCRKAKTASNEIKGGLVFLVFPKGFEPPSSEPESDILSIELRKQNRKYS